MFDAEEKVIEKARRIQADSRFEKAPLKGPYAELAEAYQKLFKQFRRMLRISDRQQIELKKSREAIMGCNLELTREVQKRQEAQNALEAANLELKRLAALDGLTQLANRRRLDQYLKQQWRLMAREKQPLSLILCDIDYFKRYNDRYGHLAGDDCLKQVADAIQSTVRRPADLVARYGGEEFAVVLPNTDPAGACHVAQRIAGAVAALHIEHQDSPVHPFLSLCIGVCGRIPSHQDSHETLIAEADLALYAAKERGRKRIVLKEEAQGGFCTV